MQISITPTITGGFVFHVMKDAKVAEHIKNLNLTTGEAHDFVKAALIAGMRDIKIDFNKSAGRRVDQVLDKIDEDMEKEDNQK